jgi:hypothetical protein
VVAGAAEVLVGADVRSWLREEARGTWSVVRATRVPEVPGSAGIAVTPGSAAVTTGFAATAAAFGLVAVPGAVGSFVDAASVLIAAAMAAPNTTAAATEFCRMLI